MLVAVHYGVGRHNYYVPDDQEVLAEKWLFLSQPTFPWSLACSKVSIAWMLIRIQRDERWWTWSMYLLMTVSVGVAIVSNVFQLSMCKPISAIWDHSTPGALCTDLHVAQRSIYITSALTIATDFALSLAVRLSDPLNRGNFSRAKMLTTRPNQPISFIIHIQRPLREKIALGFVMGLGIFASSASLAKTFMVESYGKTGDSLMDTVGLTTFSMLELQLAIIAACIPTLKRLFEMILRRWGIISTAEGGDGNSATRSRTGYLKHDDTSRSRARQHYDSHSLSVLHQQQRDGKTGGGGTARNTIDIETDSIESGEMPIMKPSDHHHHGNSGAGSDSEASLRGAGDYEPAVSPTALSDRTVFVKTAIRAGDNNNSRGRGSLPGGGGIGGNNVIQMETVVSVHSELKSNNRRRGGANIV